MTPHAKGRTRLLMAGLLVLVLVSACGQKGDLYHPEEEKSAQTSFRPAA